MNENNNKSIALEEVGGDEEKLTVPSFVFFTIIGLIIGLNQFGDSFLKFFPNKAWLSPMIEPLVKINSSVDQGFSIWLLIATITISFLIFLTLKKGLNQAFLYGIIVGFFTLPIIAILAILSTLIIIVIIKVLGWIWGVLFWILAPVFKFLGWILNPIGILLHKLYLWMEPVLKIIAVPFIWLFSFLWEYILKYLFMLLLGIIILLIGIFPFVSLGTVVIGNFKDSITKPISLITTYSVGIGLGFLFIDILISLGLNYFHIVPGYTYVICIFTVLTLLLAIVFLIRCFLQVQGNSQENVKFGDLTIQYIQYRSLDMITLVCLGSLSLILAIFSQDNDN